MDVNASRAAHPLRWAHSSQRLFASTPPCVPNSPPVPAWTPSSSHVDPLLGVQPSKRRPYRRGAAGEALGQGRGRAGAGRSDLGDGLEELKVVFPLGAGVLHVVLFPPDPRPSPPTAKREKRGREGLGFRLHCFGRPRGGFGVVGSINFVLWGNHSPAPHPGGREEGGAGSRTSSLDGAAPRLWTNEKGRKGRPT